MNPESKEPLNEADTKVLVDAFLTDNYEEIIAVIVRKYDPKKGKQSSSSSRTFETSTMDGVDLAHASIEKMLTSVNPQALEEVPSKERKKYLFGVILKQAEWVYLTTLTNQANRRRLIQESGFTMGPDTVPPNQGEFESEQAISELSPLQRALIRNPEMSQREMHKRISPDTSRKTFVTRANDEMVRVKKILDPE